MDTLRYLVVSILLATALLGTGVSATEFRSSSAVVIAEGVTIDDELYASGGSVTVNGIVTSDLLAAGGQVSVTGEVGQSASLAGGDVNLSGGVGGNLRAAGGQVTVSGSIEQNASVAAGSIIIEPGTNIGRDLNAAGGDVLIDGIIGRNLSASGGTVVVNGEVSGAVRITADRLTIGPEAVISGDLIYTSSLEAEIDPGAQVLGEIVRRPAPVREPFRVFALVLALWLLSLVAIFVVGVVLIAVIPGTMAASADRVIGAPGMSLLVGFLTLVVTPVAVIIIFLTLIGIPLALILLGMYLILLYLSRIIVALAIGRWIFARFGKPGVSLYLALLVGLPILWLVIAIPFIGWVIHMLALVIGLGALLSTRYHTIRELRSEGRM